MPTPQPANVFLDPPSLADRWERAVTIGTLAKWRMRGDGPRFLKIGRSVLYPLQAVEAWEAEHMRQAAG
jgi:hypothetical protein